MSLVYNKCYAEKESKLPMTKQYRHEAFLKICLNKCIDICKFTYLNSVNFFGNKGVSGV